MFTSVAGYLRRKTTITFRIYLFAAMMVAVLYLSAVFALSAHVKATRDDRLNAVTYIANDILMKAAAHALWRGNALELSDISTGLLASTNIESIVVKDMQGDPFFSAHNDDMGEDPMMIRVDVVRTVLSAEYEDFESDSSETINRQAQLGELIVEINTKKLFALAWNDIWSRFALLIAMGLLVLPLAYILALSLVRPLKGIQRDLKRFEQGDYDSLSRNGRPVGFYTDEYSLISRALREAGQSIGLKTREIEQNNAELKARTEQLEVQYGIAIEAREFADEANAKKDVFVRNITHELKTPLTGVIAGIDLIEQSITRLVSDASMSDSNADYLKQRAMHRDVMQMMSCVDIAKHSGHQLETLVNEILISIQDMYSDFRLDVQPVALMSSLEKLVSVQKAIALKKALSFNVSYNTSGAVWILADWLRVAQVLNALIGNAIRFTEAGSIAVSISVLENVDTVSLYVEVSDTGIGISGAEKERIFSHFHIAENPDKKVLSGIGTGLSIAQRICERIGGTLNLKNTTLGLGSSFSFSCDFHRCAEPNTLLVAQGPADRPLDIDVLNLRLLYVEDSLTNQQIFREYCDRHGVQLVLADNGKDGLEKFQHGRYDGLIVDCYMPVMNGYELVESIRGFESLNRLEPAFIVALSADNSDRNRRRCKDAGFDAFESKPYTRVAFHRIMEMVFLYKDGVVPSRQ